MTKFAKLVCLTSITALASCATTSNLNPEKLDANEGAFMGRVTILVDG